MRTELIELHNRVKTTFVYVTHDQSEAMSMADTIILMDAGKIMQQASPEVIYNDPDNVFTAQFVGTPPMNIMRMADGESYMGYRPEKVVLTKEKSDLLYSRTGVILTREMLGSETIYKVRLETSDCAEDGVTSIMVKSLDYALKEGETVHVGVAKEHLYFFNKEKNRVRPGDVSDFDKYYRLAGGTK